MGTNNKGNKSSRGRRSQVTRQYTYWESDILSLLAMQEVGKLGMAILKGVRWSILGKKAIWHGMGGAKRLYTKDYLISYIL